MSEADKMFEKLGYKLVSNKRYSVYQKEVEYTQGSEIDSITIDWGLYSRFKKERLKIGLAITISNPEYITKEEFKAIQQKISEER